jgi:predicted unusual protein kinase regulating ubiquinone biosynthesis (AarF/ABC1/UbiB family)
MVADASSLSVRAEGTAPPVHRPRVQSYRFVRAYWTTFQVIFAYLGLGLGRRLFGRSWYDERIGEAHRKNALRVERTIIKLQGLFIKVGQLLSIMANFLPEQFRTGLEGLQDQVPPRPFEDIEQRILTDLGLPVDEAFARFERRPLASASLGQVHEAYLHDGTRVAVKVQHRDIDEITRLDLKTIRRIMTIVQVFVPVRGLDAYYHQVRQMIAEELDFQREAHNIERLAANFTSDPAVVFPRVIASLSTRHVLTTTFVEGVKVGDTAAIDAARIDRKELARKIVRTYCQMMFVDGVYHADPHPGNMLARADGSLVLLDFGAVAELSPSMREGIPEFLEGVIRRDTNRLIKALKKMGFLARADDGEVSEKVIEYFHRRFQEEVRLDSFNLKDIKIDPLRSFENLLDLRRMNIGLKELSGAFHVPRDWVLLERTLLLLTGVCTQLDPEMSPMDVVSPYLQEFVLGQRDWTKIALEAARDMALQAVTLPEDMRKYLTRAVRGELEVKVKGLSDGARLVYAAVRQAIYAAGAMVASFSALSLHLHQEERLAHYCLYAGGIFATLFLLSVIFTKTRSR